jgi:hypothetical protein
VSVTVVELENAGTEIEPPLGEVESAVIENAVSLESVSVLFRAVTLTLELVLALASVYVRDAPLPLVVQPLAAPKLYALIPDSPSLLAALTSKLPAPAGS